MLKAGRGMLLALAIPVLRSLVDLQRGQQLCEQRAKKRGGACGWGHKSRVCCAGPSGDRWHARAVLTSFLCCSVASETLAGWRGLRPGGRASFPLLGTSGAHSSSAIIELGQVSIADVTTSFA